MYVVSFRRSDDERRNSLFARELAGTDIHMTDLGRLIEPHLTEIMTHAGEAKRTAGRFLKLEGASLALGIMCTVAPMLFVTFLGHFRADNPRIEITLLEGMPDQLWEPLAKGELDVALMARQFAWPTSTVSSTSRGSAASFMMYSRTCAASTAS